MMGLESKAENSAVGTVVSMKAGLGFTLVELMITITIVVILIAAGVPSFKQVTSANRISSEVNGLLGDLQLARAEAIKRGQPVTVCVSANGTSCANSTAWRSGWIVFSDPNGNASVDAAELPFVLRVQRPFTSTDTFNATNNLKSVTFNREGIATGIVAGTFIKLQDASANTAWTRCLSIAWVGMTWTQMYGTTLHSVTCS